MDVVHPAAQRTPLPANENHLVAHTPRDWRFPRRHIHISRLPCSNGDLAYFHTASSSRSFILRRFACGRAAVALGPPLRVPDGLSTRFLARGPARRQHCHSCRDHDDGKPISPCSGRRRPGFASYVQRRFRGRDGCAIDALGRLSHAGPAAPASVRSFDRSGAGGHLCHGRHAADAATELGGVVAAVGRRLAGCRRRLSRGWLRRHRPVAFAGAVQLFRHDPCGSGESRGLHAFDSSLTFASRSSRGSRAAGDSSTVNSSLPAASPGIAARASRNGSRHRASSVSRPASSLSRSSGPSLLVFS